MSPASRRCRRLPAAPAVLAVLLFLAAPALGMSFPGVPIEAGDQVTSGIDPAGDEDRFEFDGVAGGKLSVTLAPAKGSELLPSLRLYAPDGSEISTDGFVRVKKGRVVLRKLPLPVSGRYGLSVAGGDGTTGGYVLKTKAAWPKKLSARREPLGAGETIDFAIPSLPGLVVKVKIRERGEGGFEPIAFLTPDGEDLPDALALLTRKKTTVKGTLTLGRGPGDYVLRIGGASAATELDVTVKCRYPRPLRRRIELSPLEPAITAFDPPNGWDGDVISLVGENFAAEGVEVRFGEIFSPKVVCASAVRVYATVPEAEGEATLVLINPDGQACEARVPFEFRGRPPVVASIAPDRGPDSGGTDVVLRGSGLTHVVSVRLGGVPVADGPVVLTHDKIRFTTPPGGPGPADLELTDRWGQVKHLASAFLYDAAPEIHTVNPRSGSLKGGTLVTVTGSGFSSGSKVFLDGEALFYVTILGPESLRFITPAHEKGVVDLRITDRYDRSVVKPGAYEFSDAVWVDISEDILPANTEIDAYAGRALAVEDLDDDGDIDIVVGRTADPELGFLTNLLLNDGTGSFEAAGLPLSPGNGDVWQATDLAVGDLDGDGDADLVLTCDTRFQANRQYAYFISGVLYFAHDRILPSTRILVNDGEGGFSLKTDSFPSLAVQGRDTMLGSSVVLGDVDGDNDLDLILTSDRCIGVSSYTQEPDGMTFRRYFSVVPEDDRPATRVFLNDGHAYFSDATATALPPAADGDLFAGDAVRLGNVDGDGDLDILITGEGDRLRDPDFAEYVKGSRTRVLRNDGKGNFTNDTSTFMPVPTVGEDWGGCGIAIGDLDGDEWPDDLIVTSRRTLSAPTKGSTPLSSTRVLLGSAKGFSIGTGDWLPAIRSDGTGDRHRGRAAAIASIRGDSTAGIFLVGDTPVYGPDEEDGQISSLRWFRRSGELPLNNVSERLLPNPELSGHEYYGHALTFGDIDGDGEDELIITTEHPDLLKEGKRPTRVLQRR